MQVVVVGLGYVGSVCSACLASRGHQVVGVDTSTYKVDCIERGESPIVEKDLGELIAAARREGRLSATTDIARAMPGADVVLVCVGTPSREDGSLNLDHVKRACAEVGSAIASTGRFTTVVMRSTMLPGSVLDELTPVIEQAAGGKAGEKFGGAYNPEFMREGAAVDDFNNAEYTVIGAVGGWSWVDIGRIVTRRGRHQRGWFCYPRGVNPARISVMLGLVTSTLAQSEEGFSLRLKP